MRTYFLSLALVLALAGSNAVAINWLCALGIGGLKMEEGIFTRYQLFRDAQGKTSQTVSAQRIDSTTHAGKACYRLSASVDGAPFEVVSYYAKDKSWAELAANGRRLEMSQIQEASPKGERVSSLTTPDGKEHRNLLRINLSRPGDASTIMGYFDPHRSRWVYTVSYTNNLQNWDAQTWEVSEPLR